MSRFDIFLIGCDQSIPLDIDTQNIESLTKLLTCQRFLVGRFSAEAGDMAMRSVSIPVSRIKLLCESDN